MIKWGEAIRNQDPGYFCRHAIQQSCAKSKRIWIVSDARRKTDIEFFKTNYPDETYTVRINASDVVRQKRGWNYAKGVDDCESECGLDDYNQWNLEIYNDNDEQMLEGIQKVFLSTKITVSDSFMYIGLGLPFRKSTEVGLDPLSEGGSDMEKEGLVCAG
ncbi:Phosphomevalonate kinase like protein [Argiope bruennichi]|uniref:Phosphomevalonate kinase n=1 Tax=Argiope bruennichi TaxID=94029 RepID=A0A8T0ENS6_ARGBR|nr:Phosphomevalonate kinase like protein [Argiope bruennichi]